MTSSYVRVTGPVQEPITLAEAKAQARILDDNSNALLLSYIKTAREEAEGTLGYGLFTQTWKLELREFADVIPLPMALQLQSVTSVQYYDLLGALQTLSSAYYLTNQTSRPTALVRAPGMSWPSVQADRLNGVVTITYVVGWTAVANIPERIKQGIRSYVTYLDLDRAGVDLQVALAARQAAENCWTDRYYWYPPVCGRAS